MTTTIIEQLKLFVWLAASWTLGLLLCLWLS